VFVVYSNEAKTPFFEAHKLQIMGKFTIYYKKRKII